VSSTIVAAPPASLVAPRSLRVGLTTAFARADAWLFAAGDARRLAALRIGLCGLLALRLTRGSYLSLAGQPSSLFRPLSFMHALSSMPPRSVILRVQIAAFVAAVMAAVGLRARVTLPIAWAGALFLDGMATSVGKVVHNDVLLLLCLVPLLAAPTADAWSLDAPVSTRGDWKRGPAIRYGWPVRTAMVVATGAYFFTGLAKVVFSGPAWALSSNLRWVLYASSDGHAVPNHLALFIADRPLLAHGVAALTLLIELGFALVLFRPRAAWFFVPGAVGLHAAIGATMGLDYSAWAITVLVVFGDWPAAIRAVTNRRGASSLAGMGLTTILYDRDCGFCRWSMDKILAWDRRRRLRPVALQTEEADQLLPPGMDPRTRMGSWHLVTHDGRVYSAGAAAPHLFRLLPGGRPLAAVASTFPRTTQRIYRWVTNHRERLARMVGAKACAVDPSARR
jgi:predicted DCC family thiol-disulfide oxidoreductase YuxK